MKTTREKIRFVELRAAGFSYSKIADELGICKQTAINWSKELRTQIENLRAIEMDALIKSNELHQAARLQLFGAVLKGLKDELGKRDLSTLPTEQLFGQILKFSNAVAQEEIDLTFSRECSMLEALDSMNKSVDAWPVLA